MTTGNQCSVCKNYKNLMSCTAFDVIPGELFTGEVSHKDPYPGDSGIRFEPIEESENKDNVDK